SSGSSSGARPSLILLTFSGSMSTPTTSKPLAARVAPMHEPSFPKPHTETVLIESDARFCVPSSRCSRREPVSGALCAGAHLPAEPGAILASASIGVLSPRLFCRHVHAGLDRRNSSIGWVNGDALEPDFTPPQMDAASTKHPSTAIECLAGHPFQDNRGRIHSPHPPGLFVHEALDASADAKRLAAERHELGIKRETPVGEPAV